MARDMLYTDSVHSDHWFGMMIQDLAQTQYWESTYSNGEWPAHV